MMIASRHLEIRFVTLCLLLSPIFTLGLAWVVMDDLPTGREMLGGAVMLVGIAIPVAGALRTKRLGGTQP
ncbi:MAG: hypothetical protein JRH01_06160 [Deltaproteobacteria bacterium]|nr:hypothetical protein [Deltaproteobacteria bacterium]MBW2393347.1 hypothetical protein [Deltaproteobacteria bacterium]